MRTGTRRFGIDIGGTFTDFILLDDAGGTIRVDKVLTTPSDPSVAVLNGAAKALTSSGTGWNEVSIVNHATTLVTNALIERKGVRTGLLTTKGFRDTLLIGTERRYDIYDIFLDLPEPIVPRFLTEEIRERVLPDGTVLEPLDVAQATAAIQTLLARGVASIAVTLLHSYANPAHEQQLRDLIHQLAPKVTVSLSSEVLPEMREYFRASTTAINAYVQPTVRQYIERLQAELRAAGMTQRFYLMQSNGGTSSVHSALEHPVRLLESGPAAGALAAAFFGQLAGIDDLLSFDMGGTTAKLCLIEDGNPIKTNYMEAARIHRFKPGSGVPVKIPVIELIEIGAGGGSIASIDPLGLLKVGPHSAGADPGPACYDRGGHAPTVSDADLVLGYLNPDFFLGGEMDLSVENAHRAINQGIAQAAGMSVLEAAAGIHRVVNEQMALAAKMHIIEKGQDPRRYAMVAFGGAGPVHAFGVAKALKLPRVVYPLGAGAASAIGLLVAPTAFDLMRTHKTPLRDADFVQLNDVYADLEAEGRNLLRDADVAPADMAFVRTADMRYLGQGYEIEVPIPKGELTRDDVDTIQHHFDSVYEDLYGRLSAEVPVEFVTLRLVASAPRPEFPLHALTSAAGHLEAAHKGIRPAYFEELGGFVDCDVYDRYRLPSDSTFSGPAIVEERESTVVIGPDTTCRIDPFGNLIVDLQMNAAPTVREEELVDVQS